MDDKPGMSEMPISQARDHISQIVRQARYGHEPTVLTHFRSRPRTCPPVAAMTDRGEWNPLSLGRKGAYK